MRISTLKNLFVFVIVLSGLKSFAQPSNDTPCAAESIVVDGAIASGDNTGATADINEIVPPPGAPPEPCYTAWCNGDTDVQASIWYTFIAPENGAVNVTTCLEGTTEDTQIAVWEATDCSDYTTFNYLGANDDMIDACTVGNQYASTASVDGLTPGNLYYVQVDTYDGTEGTIDIQITTGTPTSFVNFIHNSGDIMLGTVDIRIDGELYMDDFMFQTCSGYIPVPADSIITITINASDSNDDLNPIYSFDASLNSTMDYIATIIGIASTTGYSPAPSVSIALFAGAEQSAANPGDMALLFQHGITDAPEFVDVSNAVSGDPFNVDLAFGGYSSEGFINMTAQNISIQTTDNETDLGLTFCAPFANAAPFQIGMVVAYSGFVNPANNSNGAPAGLFAVNHIDGTFMPLLPGECPVVANDNVCNAIELSINDAPTEFDNSFATVEMNETSPTNLPNDDPEADCLTQWCDGVLNGTVWFKFSAPESGNVIVTTCFDVTIDTQLAVCTIDDCNNYSTLSYILQNDDMENGCGGGDEFASYLIVDGLTPGNMYYIQVDGWEGMTGVANIQVLDNNAVAEVSSTTLKAYPIPAKEQIRIEGLNGNAQIQICDMTGKIHFNGLYRPGSAIDINSLATGVYQIIVKGTDGIKTIRMIKE